MYACRIDYALTYHYSEYPRDNRSVDQLLRAARPKSKGLDYSPRQVCDNGLLERYKPVGSGHRMASFTSPWFTSSPHMFPVPPDDGGDGSSDGGGADSVTKCAAEIIVSVF